MLAQPLRRGNYLSRLINGTRTASQDLAFCAAERHPADQDVSDATRGVNLENTNREERLAAKGIWFIQIYPTSRFGVDSYRLPVISRAK